MAGHAKRGSIRNDRSVQGGSNPGISDLAGIALIAIGIMAFITIFYQAHERAFFVGRAGIAIAASLRFLSGTGAALIPLMVLTAGVLSITTRHRIAPRIVGLIVIMFSILSILDLASVRAILRSWGVPEPSGGLLGGLLSSFLAPAFGEVGALILLLLFGWIGAAAALDVSLLALGRMCLRWTRYLAAGLVALLRWLLRGSSALISFFHKKSRREISSQRAQGVTSGQGESTEAASTREAAASKIPIIIDAGHEFPLAGDAPVFSVEPQDAAQVAGQIGKGKGQGRAMARGDMAAAQKPGESVAVHQSIPIVEDPVASYTLPPISILRRVTAKRSVALKDSQSVLDRARLLEETLLSFGVQAKVLQVSRGPVVTRFEIQPGPGVKVSRIVNLSDDIALALAAVGVRVEAPIPGKSAVGIEVPNKEIATVYLREVLESQEFRAKERKIPIVIGKDIAGTPVVGDLVSMLHLLVAGATGSGKSVCLNTLISTILFTKTPDEVKLLMIDPKRVELTTFDEVPHLLAPVVTDTKEAAGYLRWVAGEMDRRYKLLEEAGVRNIEKYNEACLKGKLKDQEALPLPYIVVIIDELGDLMMVAQKEVEDVVCQLAFMARAAGIHLVVATQRPSADVITGVIKMNIPSRIAFAVPSQIDSRVILDSGGAERLLGRGDMLFFPVGAPKPIRVQGAYVSDAEVELLVNYVRGQGTPKYEAESVAPSQESEDSRGAEDDLFDEAVRVVMETQEASISRLQRRLRIGYNRAASLIEAMELRGIVGPPQGSKPRKVLVGPDRFGQGMRRQ
ncbi:MAG: DNA translocase FtsK [Firmicutes bacterium]|nr:DNA translocase FtsK [Bacillota bacterium]